MHDYWVEFAKVALAHLLAVASPGPDFALVLKQSLMHGRRTAVWTSIGIGSGILLHISYSLLGIGILIRSSELWFNIVKYVGAAYLTWVGIQALRAKPRATIAIGVTDARAVVRARGAFAAGFLTNALNPKATLFFVAVFTVVIDPHTPRIVQAAYGLWMGAATAGWFSVVSMVFTQDGVRTSFLRFGHWIDRMLGVVFLAFAASLVVASLK